MAWLETHNQAEKSRWQSSWDHPNPYLLEVVDTLLPPKRPSEEKHEKLSDLFPPNFPRFRIAQSLNDIGMYLANASYVISLGGTPTPDIKYGIIAVPLGQEKLLFGEYSQTNTMTPDFLQAVRDARYVSRVDASLHSLNDGNDNLPQGRGLGRSETDNALNDIMETSIIDPGVKQTAPRGVKRKQRDDPESESDGRTKAVAVLSGPARGQGLDSANTEKIVSARKKSISNPKKPGKSTADVAEKPKHQPHRARRSPRSKKARPEKEPAPPTRRAPARAARGKKAK